MKLLRKISVNNLIITGILFVIGGIFYYYIIDSILNDELQEKLFDRKHFVISQLKRNHIPDDPPYVQVREINNPGTNNNVFSDVEISEINYPDDKEKEEDETEQYRQLISYVSVYGKFYEVIVRQSLIEKEDLIYAILISIGLLFVLLFISILVSNYIISLKIFRPFRHNLKLLRKFSLMAQDLPEFRESNIREFNELKDILEWLTRKVRDDYRNLKEFTENASHEIQTPLAVITTKIETLMQKNIRDKEQAELISDVYRSAGRLSRLNKALILLSKIENRQFPENETVNMDGLIKEYLDEFSFLFEQKQIDVSVDSNAALTVNMNKFLAGILIKNLLENAVKHNIDKGEILIETGDSRMIFSNTGGPEPADPEKIFSRFSKGRSSESTGLGLSIIKRICDNYNFGISYYYSNGLHHFAIDFQLQN